MDKYEYNLKLDQMKSLFAEEKYEEAAEGWYYSQRLKSVQIHYTNPKKDHKVLISFEQFDLIGM